MGDPSDLAPTDGNRESGTLSDDRIIGVAAPLRKEVVKRIHESIASLEFRPGDRLVESALCTRYGVSRTVIREAIRHLEAEGIVKCIPNRGPVVTPVSRSEARALYDVRVVLFGLAGRLFAERATERECKRLQEALTDLEEVMGTGLPSAFVPAKDELIGALLQGGHNEVLSKMVVSTNARVSVMRSTVLQEPERHEQFRKELRAIVQAAAVDRDPDRAERMCKLHIQNATASTLALIPPEDGGAVVG